MDLLIKKADKGILSAFTFLSIISLVYSTPGGTIIMAAFSLLTLSISTKPFHRLQLTFK